MGGAAPWRYYQNWQYGCAVIYLFFLLQWPLMVLQAKKNLYTAIQRTTFDLKHKSC